MSETRKLAAILVSDVVGYSRLAGADEDRILARLRTLRSDLIDPTIAVHHGRIVKRTGDGSIIEFRSVVDAVNLAIEVQRAMVERNAEVAPDKRIEFRIGIHLGDVVEESDGDLMGDGVNIAARLQGVAKPGGICISDDAYRQVKSRLDLKVSDLGPVPLKNISEPMRAYSLEVGVPAQAKPAKPADSVTPALPKRRSAVGPLAAGITALLILIAGGAWWFLNANRAAPVASNAPPPLVAQRLSIVVLPFANLSGDPAQDYLADALTDELTTALARIRDSFVIARNTAFTYKGKPVDAKSIGKDLGVRYVLEGSVLPSANQVRVNAQLIDADSGAHLWADQFDTLRADLLQMQDAIVTHLARAMDFQLTEAEAARLKRTPAANPSAEDLALQCVAAVRKVGYFGGGAEAAYGLCERALALDPNNVRALAYLAIKFRIGVGTKADLKRADELVSKALALDPNYAQAHGTKAYMLLDQMRLDEAIAEDESALALDPAYSDAYANMGEVSRQLGRFEKSLEYVDKAIRLSPRDATLGYWYDLKAQDYFGLNRYDQAIEWARRAIALIPNYPWAHRDLIAALALSGHEAEAGEALQRFLALPPGGSGGFRTIAAVKAYQAQRTGPRSDPAVVDLFDRRIEGLRKAGMPEE
ncbi:MAG TPA: tetratricopeptide repeat protein [Roseiarcus sp.]|nr:tetratricopeptide repeat protein [Roseiarcus sp.]